jgi:hypothetical protein
MIDPFRKVALRLEHVQTLDEAVPDQNDDHHNE